MILTNPLRAFPLPAALSLRDYPQHRRSPLVMHLVTETVALREGYPVTVRFDMHERIAQQQAEAHDLARKHLGVFVATGTLTRRTEQRVPSHPIDFTYAGFHRLGQATCLPMENYGGLFIGAYLVGLHHMPSEVLGGRNMLDEFDVVRKQLFNRHGMPGLDNVFADMFGLSPEHNAYAGTITARLRPLLFGKIGAAAEHSRVSRAVWDSLMGANSETEASR